MESIVALLILAVALGGLGYFHYRESQAWRTERADLLNRLMARTYQEFVYATPSAVTSDVPQLTTDQAEQAWYAAQQRESEAAA